MAAILLGRQEETCPNKLALSKYQKEGEQGDPPRKLNNVINTENVTIIKYELALEAAWE